MIPRRLSLLGLLVAGALMLSSTLSAPLYAAPAQQSPSPDARQLMLDNTAFAFDLYQSLRVEHENLIVSLYSISEVLAMTFAGARGNTAHQMAHALHYTLPPERLPPAFQTLDARLHEMDDADFALHVVNALWGQQGFGFVPEFVEPLNTFYGAGLQEVDYVGDAEAARETINGWVAEHTADRIPELIAPGVLNAQTRLVLTNAVYFNATWAFPFNPDETDAAGIFTLLDGSTVTVPLMSRDDAEFAYLAGNKDRPYDMAALPYANERMVMVIILPYAGAFEEVEASLEAETFVRLLGELVWDMGRVMLPKFSTETSLSLPETLQALGMVDAFDPMHADFSGMTGTPDLHISEVVHQAVIAVDEHGTEAAAGSAVVMEWRSVPETALLVDHPFIYALVDLDTGTILFLGRMMNPAE